RAFGRHEFRCRSWTGGTDLEGTTQFEPERLGLVGQCTRGSTEAHPSARGWRRVRYARRTVISDEAPRRSSAIRRTPTSGQFRTVPTAGGVRSERPVHLHREVLSALAFVRRAVEVLRAEGDPVAGLELPGA